MGDVILLVIKEKLIPFFLPRLGWTLLILGGTFLLRTFLFQLISRLLTKIEDGDPTTISRLEARAYTLSSISRSLINTFLLLSSGLIILSQWQIDIRPFLAGAGIIGLAIGFGSQSLVKDIVTGFFILLENRFNVGDQVKIGSVQGEVKELNLRTTILIEKDGTIHILPNSKIDLITKYPSPQSTKKR